MKAYFQLHQLAERPGQEAPAALGRQIDLQYDDEHQRSTRSPTAAEACGRTGLRRGRHARHGGEPGRRPYLNSSRVRPHLHRREQWGTNYKKYPWTIGWQPDYIAEGRLYGQDIRRNRGEREGGGPVPERQLREGLPGRLQVGARHGERAAQIVNEESLGGRQRRASVAADQAPGERCRHPRHLRHADADDPDLRGHQPARLEARQHLRQLGVRHRHVHDDPQSAPRARRP